MIARPIPNPGVPVPVVPSPLVGPSTVPALVPFVAMGSVVVPVPVRDGPVVLTVVVGTVVTAVEPFG